MVSVQMGILVVVLSYQLFLIRFIPLKISKKTIPDKKKINDPTFNILMNRIFGFGGVSFPLGFRIASSLIVTCLRKAY